VNIDSIATGKIQTVDFRIVDGLQFGRLCGRNPNADHISSVVRSANPQLAF